MPNNGGTSNPVFTLVGNWQQTAVSNDGGNSWSSQPDIVKEFNSDGTMDYGPSGSTIQYFYNYCSTESMYRYGFDQQVVNQNCNCENTNTFGTFDIEVTTQNEFVETLCDSDGQNRVKFVRQ